MSAMMMSKREAKRLTKTPKTAIVKEWDAWGREHAWSVTWVPLIDDGVDLALDNVDRCWVLWADEPPVYAAHTQFGGVDLLHDIQELVGTYAFVHEPIPVDTVRRLKPGCYFAEKLPRNASH